MRLSSNPLPLAIVVIAGLLDNKNKTRHDWEEIARNVSSATAEHISEILSLSYNHLPHHLKPLLLYIGGFPEDYEIRVSELVKLWIAEGFLKSVESKSLEDVAEEYLQDLVNRNLVLITKKRSNGTIKCCGIHDVLRDFCIQISRHEDFLRVVHFNFPPIDAGTARYLYTHRGFRYPPQLKGAKEFGSHVRSTVSRASDSDVIFSTFGSRLLRVLSVKRYCAFRFSAAIVELLYLRYLTAGINEIPPSISLLQNLQTLIIKSHWSGGEFITLPSQIREMPNLRHIMSIWPQRLKCEFFDEKIVDKSSILENLQTLSGVYNVKFTHEAIQMIPNLRKLKVWYLEEKTRGAVEWKKRLGNLFYLCQLESLSIYFVQGKSEVSPLPESFAFPSTLKKLSLRRCHIPWKDMTVVGSLPNLQVLKLRDKAFVGKRWEPVKGEFPQLKFLLMDNLDLEYWQAEDTHFPNLQHLKISSCWSLQEIPSEIGEIPTLELVEVHYSELPARSALKMEEEQRDMGNNVLQVHVNCNFENSSEDEIQEENESESWEET